MQDFPPETVCKTVERAAANSSRPAPGELPCNVQGSGVLLDLGSRDRSQAYPDVKVFNALLDVKRAVNKVSSS